MANTKTDKHSASDLAQMQSLPLDAKVRMTQERVRQWYDHWDGDVYVSFSGGKDSTVLKHMVDNCPGIGAVPSVFVNTGLEYPEIQKFVRSMKDGGFAGGGWNTDVEILYPSMQFGDVIREYGYPIISKEVSQRVYDARRQARLAGIDVRESNFWNRTFNPESEHGRKYPTFCLSKYDYLFDSGFGISDKCCSIMKKNPAKEYEKRTGRHPIVGTMATESSVRKSGWMRYGCNAFDLIRPISSPMSFWTEQDVLEYIVLHKLPYASVYGEIVEEDEIAGQMCFDGMHGKLCTTGVDRTGCMFCLFGVHLEKEPNRFQRMKVTHPKQWAYCMDKLGLREVLEYIGVPYE